MIETRSVIHLTSRMNYSDQPCRYSVWTYLLASGRLGNSILTGSHSRTVLASFTRRAMLPRSMTSVSGAGVFGKSVVDFLPALMAAIHSSWMPGRAGDGLLGPLVFLHQVLGQEARVLAVGAAYEHALGPDEQDAAAVVAHHPAVLDARFGRGGISPPSYQTILTGGILPRAGTRR